MSGSERTYELRLSGLLGPLLLASLPHAAVSLEPRHTLVVTQDDDVLRAVLQRLADVGVEVESVRQVAPAAEGPGRRDDREPGNREPGTRAAP